MFIIEVEHSLDKQEMIDIYQNIMPDSSLKAVKEQYSFAASPNAPYSGPHDWMPAASVEGGIAVQTISLSALSPQNFLNPAFTRVFKRFGGLAPGPGVPPLVHKENSINKNWLNSSREFYSNLKFMTFKIKQKGKKDYANYRKKQIERTIKNQVFDKISDPEDLKNTKVEFDVVNTLADKFGYNWPYDDFSLIEAVKIDVEIEVEK